MRSLNGILGKNEKFLAHVQKLLAKFDEDKLMNLSKTSEFDGMPFDIICKVDQWNKRIEGFCFIFYETPNNLSPTSPFKSSSPTRYDHYPIENLLDSLEGRNKDRRYKRRPKSFRRATVLSHGSQPLQEASSMIFGEDTVRFFSYYVVLICIKDIDRLRDTIVSEYLPDDITRNVSEEESVNLP